MVYAFGNAIIKYQMGYMYIPGYGSESPYECIVHECYRQPHSSPTDALGAVAYEVPKRNIPSQHDLRNSLGP